MTNSEIFNYDEDNKLGKLIDWGLEEADSMINNPDVYFVCCPEMDFSTNDETWSVVGGGLFLDDFDLLMKFFKEHQGHNLLFGLHQDCILLREHENLISKQERDNRIREFIDDATTRAAFYNVEIGFKIDDN